MKGESANSEKALCGGLHRHLPQQHVIFAETEEEAESYADKLYATGEYDPENDGYDGCDVTARECSVTEAAEYRVRDIFEAE